MNDLVFSQHALGKDILHDQSITSGWMTSFWLAGSMNDDLVCFNDLRILYILSWLR